MKGKLKAKSWMQKENDREEWTSVVKQAKVLPGPQSQGISKATQK
jgi:hypothetical protein